jgi:hypothetical protein
MVSISRFRRICLSLEGTSETPHFDRAAFRVARIYATLKTDDETANLKFEPDEQALLCEMHPGIFVPVAGGWGKQGWTSVHLAKVSEPVLSQALRSAWSGAHPKPKSVTSKRRPK